MSNTGADAPHGDQREAFINRTEASWDRWLMAIDGLSDDQIMQPNTCGNWSVKDLMGHIATWDEVALDKLRRIRAGEARQDTGETVDAFNARAAESLAGESTADLRTRMHESHALLMPTLATSAWPSAETFQWVEYAITDDTWKHYDEHCQQIADRFPALDVP